MQCALWLEEGIGLPHAEASPRRYQTGRHLAAFLLLLIAQRPDHGGSLIERLQSLQPPGWTVDSGRVYRLLRTMEEQGALRSNWEIVAAGPQVRVYRITESGQVWLRKEAEQIEARRDALSRFLRIWQTEAQT